MAQNNDAHISDVGTAIFLYFTEDAVPFDISLATTKELLFQKKNRETFKKDGTFVTDGSDGGIVYVTEDETILDVAGEWKVQGYIELPSGKWHSDIFTFNVGENIIVSGS